MINFKMSLVKLTAKTLSREEANALVDSFTQELKKLPEIQEIILFGSAARGEMTEASDVDLVAIFPSKELARSGSKLFHKNRKYFWPVDILFVDRAYYDSRKNLGGVLFVAREEGKTIFRKSHDSQG